ncbi:MAG TPA: Glu-tRNA(Gln) amidotransferase subunit GatD [Thermoplasmata archaeon]|nr:Glu-tRNA(Gln) amidotransferase subunit GatD [Thermoplasmata archaeon]
MSEKPSEDPWELLRRLPMGQEVEVEQADGHQWRGTLVPAHELSTDRTIQLKLSTGYNVGIIVRPEDRVKVLSKGTEANGNGDAPAPPKVGRVAEGPWVDLLTTGGTIASRVDYRTGGVRPVKEESEILQFYPDLDRDGPVRVTPVFDRLSEDIQPEDWLVLAEKVGESFRAGAQGVVIAHGTDTLAFTAAALSFLLEHLPGPVVLVGAQRSPDRPSSDGFTNITNAVRVARRSELAEVVVLMHAGLSDDRFSIHRGTQVRKMHSSRRDAFASRNGAPLGFVKDGQVEFTRPVRHPASEKLLVHTHLDRAGALLWFHPGLEPARARTFAHGLRGIILAGTGLGHVSSNHLPWIRDAVRSGVVVGMTTQCLAGDVDPYVYATGRELLRAGVLYLNDLLPETAYVKLLWALGQSQEPAEVGRLLLQDRAGEFEPRHEPGASS